MDIFRKEGSTIDLSQHAGAYRGLSESGLHRWEIKDPWQEPFQAILRTVCSALDKCRLIPLSAHMMIDIYLLGNSVSTCIAYIIVSGLKKHHGKAAIKHLKKELRSLLQEHRLKVDYWPSLPHAPNIDMMGSTGPVEGHILYQCPEFQIRQLTSYDITIYTITTKHTDDTTPRSGVLRCKIHVGATELILVPAHIFTPRQSEQLDEDIDMEDAGSDDASDLFRAGSATPSDIQSASDESSQEDRAQESSPEISNARKSPEYSPEETELFRPLVTKDFWAFSLDLDYALIPVPQEERFHDDLISLTDDHTQAIPIGLHSVSVITPSQGNMNGMLDGRPVLVRLPYSTRFSRLYAVTFPDPINEGDCGSLVIDRERAEIYGFIVAASREGRMAYIVSMHEVLRDIAGKFDQEHKPETYIEAMSSDVQFHQYEPSESTTIQAYARPSTASPRGAPSPRREGTFPFSPPPSEFSAGSQRGTVPKPFTSGYMAEYRGGPPNLLVSPPPSVISAGASAYGRLSVGMSSLISPSTASRNQRDRVRDVNRDRTVPKGAMQRAVEADVWACPFYKHEPWSYPRCRVQRLTRMSDVRQHIVRVHAQPFHCPRCGTVFEGSTRDRDRNHHIQSMTCKQQVFSLPGADLDQLGQIRKGGEEPGHETPEVGRWYRIWKVMFPDAPPPSSPYYHEWHELADRLAKPIASLAADGHLQRLIAQFPGQEELLSGFSHSLLNMVTEQAIWLESGKAIEAPPQSAPPQSETSQHSRTQPSPDQIVPPPWPTVAPAVATDQIRNEPGQSLHQSAASPLPGLQKDDRGEHLDDM